MSVSAVVHPTQLANILANAVILSKEKAPPKPRGRPLTAAQIKAMELTQDEVQAVLRARTRPGQGLTVDEVAWAIAARPKGQGTTADEATINTAKAKDWALSPEEAEVIETARENTRAVSCDHILLAYQADAAGAALYSYGMGRHLAGRTKLVMDSRPSEESFSVCIDRAVADTMQSMLRKIKGGMAARVSVTIHPEPVAIWTTTESGQPTQAWVNFTIENGDERIVELLDSDPAGESDPYWDALDRFLAASAAPTGPSMMFLAEVLAKLKDIKSDGLAIDLKKTSHDHVVAVAIGSLFRGVIADIGREVYAAGGPWRDGPGTPAHLL